jgi:hypothetical protein
MEYHLAFLFVCVEDDSGVKEFGDVWIVAEKLCDSWGHVAEHHRVTVWHFVAFQARTSRAATVEAGQRQFNIGYDSFCRADIILARADNERSSVRLSGLQKFTVD